MGKQQMQSGLKVGVALTTPTLKLHLELHEMLLDVLSTLGHLPVLVVDGERDALEADILLIVGDCKMSEGFARFLRNRDGRKPTTILWHLNTLPPLELGEQAEENGLQSADLWGRVQLPPGRFSRVLKSVIPVSVRSKARRAITWALFLRTKRELSKNPLPVFQRVDTSSCRNMMCRYRWIQRRFLDGCIDIVFVSSVPQMEFLTSRGIPAEFAPVGYHPGLGENLETKQDIDVLFIGTGHPQRQATLDALRRSLASKGITLVTVEGDCYGNQRAELLNRARISLNMVKNPWSLPGIRFLMSMGCGALVVSEPLHDSTPYKAGEHFVQASVTDLPDVIAYFLKHTSEREAILRLAHNFVTRQLTLEKAVSQIIGVYSVGSRP